MADCQYYRDGRGRPLKVRKTLCVDNQRQRKNNCFRCPHSYHYPVKENTDALQEPNMTTQEKNLTVREDEPLLPFTLTELHNRLFSQLDRLTAVGMSKEEREWDLKCANAAGHLGQVIINNASLVLKAHKIVADSLTEATTMPAIITRQKATPDPREPDLTDLIKPVPQVKAMPEDMAAKIFQLAEKLAGVDKCNVNIRGEGYKLGVGDDLVSVALETAMEAWNEYAGPESGFISHITPALQAFIKCERSKEFARKKTEISLDAPAYKDGEGRTLHETIAAPESEIELLTH